MKRGCFKSVICFIPANLLSAALELREAGRGVEGWEGGNVHTTTLHLLLSNTSKKSSILQEKWKIYNESAAHFDSCRA